MQRPLEEHYDLAHPATAIAYGVTVDTDGDNAGDALPTSKSSFLGHVGLPNALRCLLPCRCRRP